jgi:hypothetical protein
VEQPYSGPVDLQVGEQLWKGPDFYLVATVKKYTADHICLTMGIAKPNLHKYIESEQEAKSKSPVSVRMHLLAQ